MLTRLASLFLRAEHGEHFERGYGIKIKRSVSLIALIKVILKHRFFLFPFPLEKCPKSGRGWRGIYDE
jgi:hypothetical protein